MKILLKLLAKVLVLFLRGPVVLARAVLRFLRVVVLFPFRPLPRPTRLQVKAGAVILGVGLFLGGWGLAAWNAHATATWARSSLYWESAVDLLEVQAENNEDFLRARIKLLEEDVAKLRKENSELWLQMHPLDLPDGWYVEDEGLFLKADEEEFCETVSVDGNAPEEECTTIVIPRYAVYAVSAMRAPQTEPLSFEQLLGLWEYGAYQARVAGCEEVAPLCWVVQFAGMEFTDGSLHEYVFTSCELNWVNGQLLGADDIDQLALVIGMGRQLGVCDAGVDQNYGPWQGLDHYFAGERQ